MLPGAVRAGDPVRRELIVEARRSPAAAPCLYSLRKPYENHECDALRSANACITVSASKFQYQKQVVCFVAI